MKVGVTIEVDVVSAKDGVAALLVRVRDGDGEVASERTMSIAAGGSDKQCVEFTLDLGEES